MRAQGALNFPYGPENGQGAGDMETRARETATRQGQVDRAQGDRGQRHREQGDRGQGDGEQRDRVHPGS